MKRRASIWAAAAAKRVDGSDDVGEYRERTRGADDHRLNMSGWVGYVLLEQTLEEVLS
jgi:hypothetical protein